MSWSPSGGLFFACDNSRRVFFRVLTPPHAPRFRALRTHGPRPRGGLRTCTIPTSSERPIRKNQFHPFDLGRSVYFYRQTRRRRAPDCRQHGVYLLAARRPNALRCLQPASGPFRPMNGGESPPTSFPCSATFGIWGRRRRGCFTT